MNDDNLNEMAHSHSIDVGERLNLRSFKSIISLEQMFFNNHTDKKHLNMKTAISHDFFLGLSFLFS